jgi:hypothetical protein
MAKRIYINYGACPTKGEWESIIDACTNISANLEDGELRDAEQCNAPDADGSGVDTVLQPNPDDKTSPLNRQSLAPSTNPPSRR